MPLPAPVEKFVSDLDKTLHQPNKVTDVLATIEQKTGVKRLHVVGGEFEFAYLIEDHRFRHRGSARALSAVR
jgi:hypothetical protein